MDTRCAGKVRKEVGIKGEVCEDGGGHEGYEVRFGSLVRGNVIENYSNLTQFVSAPGLRKPYRWINTWA